MVCAWFRIADVSTTTRGNVNGDENHVLRRESPGLQACGNMIDKCRCAEEASQTSTILGRRYRGSPMYSEGAICSSCFPPMSKINVSGKGESTHITRSSRRNGAGRTKAKRSVRTEDALSPELPASSDGRTGTITIPIAGTTTSVVPHDQQECGARP